MGPEWIAVDWGLERQRAWAMRGADALGRVEQFDPAPPATGSLIGLISDWLQDRATPVVACGALGPVGPAVPCKPLSDGVWSMDLDDPRIRLHVVPGLRQTAPVDMMQGDETRVAGFLALNTDWDGVLCLPGAESRWIHVSAGEVVSFQTFLTGRLLGALSAKALLGRWVGGDDLDAAAFEAALSDALAKPERIFARLYGIQAEGVLDGLEAAEARARLCGALIGAELAAARPFWLGQQLAVIGDGPMAQLYVDALSVQGAPAALADEARMTRQGLIAAWRLLGS